MAARVDAAAAARGSTMVAPASGEARESAEHAPVERLGAAGDLAGVDAGVDDEREVAEDGAVGIGLRDRGETGACAGREVHLAHVADVGDSDDVRGEGGLADAPGRPHQSDATRDDGAQPIGADDEAGAELDGRVVVHAAGDAGDAAGTVAEEPGHVDGAELRAAGQGAAEQDVVEHLPRDRESRGRPRRIVRIRSEPAEEGNAAGRENLPPAQAGGPVGEDGVEEAEAGEEGGDGGAQAVATGLGAWESFTVEEQDGVPARGKEPGGNGSGRTSADDDDIPLVHEGPLAHGSGGRRQPRESRRRPLETSPGG